MLCPNCGIDVGDEATLCEDCRTAAQTQIPARQAGAQQRLLLKPNAVERLHNTVQAPLGMLLALIILYAVVLFTTMHNAPRQTTVGSALMALTFSGTVAYLFGGLMYGFQMFITYGFLAGVALIIAFLAFSAIVSTAIPLVVGFIIAVAHWEVLKRWFLVCCLGFVLHNGGLALYAYKMKVTYGEAFAAHVAVFWRISRDATRHGGGR